MERVTPGQRPRPNYGHPHVRWFQAGLTAVRRDIQRRPEGSVPAFDPEVFGARFLLMRRPDKLDAGERARLDALFAAHPRLKAAWDALAELHGLYLADDREGALEALDRFADIYGTGQLPEFSDTVDTLLAWSDEIRAFVFCWDSGCWVRRGSC